MKFKQYLIIILLVAIVRPAIAQEDERAANYHFKLENFAVSLKLYQKLLNKDSSNTDYLYRLGISYLYCNSDPSKALTYLKKVENEHKTDPDFLFDIGKAYLYNHDFKNAKKSFEQCRNLSGKIEKLNQDANTWYSMSTNAERMIKSPLDVSFINMGKSINSPMDEITPFVTGDNDILLYTSNEKYDHKYFIYSKNIIFSTKDNGTFKKAKMLSSVNTMDDEFMAGVSLTNERIFIQLQGYEGFQDLVSSDRKRQTFYGKFGMSKNINSKFAEFAAYESTSGDSLFFSSNRDGGFGGFDIYYCLKLPTGEWGAARNLGEKINTKYDEDFPVLSSTGNKFYFTSNRPESMGGFDIFESKFHSKSRELSQPRNIGYPLNDVYDNKTIAFSDNDRYAYVSAIKPGGFGFADLYQVVFNKMDPRVKILILNVNIQNGENLVKAGELESSLKITAFRKGKVIFGEYLFDSKNSSSTIALPPGSYTIEITGSGTEKYSHKITVPDAPTGNKIEKKAITLSLKK